MSLVRHIVFQTLTYNFQFKTKHISSVCNAIADALSRGQMQRFRELVPNAEDLPKKIEQEFLNLLKLIGATLAPSTTTMYDNAVRSFDNFRINHNLPATWPPSIN